MSNKLSSQQAAEIGTRLKAARLLAGHTLQEVSVRSGVNYTQLSRFERGGFKTRSKNVQKICMVLQISSVVEPGSDGRHRELAGRAVRIR